MDESPKHSRTRLVFVHLPKTGGTSLHAALARHFPAEAIFRADGVATWGGALTQPDRFRFFSGHLRFSHIGLVPRPAYVVTVLRDPVERLLSLYTFWKRHQDPTKAQLRIAMDADLLGFLRSTDPHVRAGIDNAMARQLFGNALIAPDGGWTSVLPAKDAPSPLSDTDITAGALANLDHCDAVGFMTDLPALYCRVCADLGWVAGDAPGRLNARDTPHPDLRDASPPEAVTPQVQAELERLTRLDRVVYEAALVRASAVATGRRIPAGDLTALPGTLWPLDPAGFVNAVYRGVLGRAPGPHGLAVHTVALTDGTLSPAEMLRRFLASEEFRAKQR